MPDADNDHSTSRNADRGNPTSATDWFATTHWTLVAAVGDQDSPAAAAALEELCRTYWQPLYAYVRRRGHSREDAEDLTQGFFARLLERNDLVGLSPDRGRFRAFLLAAFNHFLANEWKYRRRLKRGGAGNPLSLDWREAESRYAALGMDGGSPDRLYDRAWVVTLLDRVLARLAEECAAEGKGGVFARLKGCLMLERGEIPYPDMARETGLSEGALRVAVHRLRRRYRGLLRREIARTLTRADQVDAELQSLFAALEGRG
ncbi:MAG: sigma-70 family RNA polymerase sigma factor [Verrucomicrobiales bacterium]|nr:sigma-70 family RNA polymerase sigma factor [Verrucomicrobiales bacterium]MCP5526516.1 sigma-70 family RNA polymerase sigma factor [Verrucomicrobiales bacterium]